MMERDPRLRFAVDQHPIDGASAAIRRQQRPMQIEASGGGISRIAGLTMRR